MNKGDNDMLEWRLILRFGRELTRAEISDCLGPADDLYRAPHGMLYQPPGAPAPAPASDAAGADVDAAFGTDAVADEAAAAAAAAAEQLRAADRTVDGVVATAKTKETWAEKIASEVLHYAGRVHRLRLGHLNVNWFT
eukprot:SAG22_NODE_5428_length_1014_cov_1.784699_1_plen_137_part_10